MKKQQPFVLTGLSLLFLIFTVLCIGILSLLSLGNSRSSRKLSEASLQHTLDYYEAVSASADLCSQLQQELERISASSHSRRLYEQEVKKALPLLFPQCVYEEEQNLITASFPFSDTQTFFLSLQLLYPEKEGDPWIQITEAYTTSSREWKGEYTNYLMKEFS